MLSPLAKLKWPLLLAVTAPLLVLFGLRVLHSVWWTFLLYQVLVCLVTPALTSWRNGLNWQEHCNLLGLSARIPYTAWVLGVLTAALTAAFLEFTKSQIFAPNQVSDTLANWGVGTYQAKGVLLTMVVLNAPAEELFWRGYLPGRVEHAFAATTTVQLLTIIATAILYASYHFMTINQLIADHLIGGVMIAGVVGAGMFWGWLRWKTGNVWHALLSHVGAVFAYMALGFN